MSPKLGGLRGTFELSPRLVWLQKEGRREKGTDGQVAYLVALGKVVFFFSRIRF